MVEHSSQDPVIMGSHPGTGRKKMEEKLLILLVAVIYGCKSFIASVHS
jgi:hypothetical protein